MADTPIPLSFDTSFDPQTGHAVPIEPGVVRVTAPNAGPYTFTGTNSFILGDGPVAVLDPGPDDARHRAALLAAAGGRKVEAIMLTHTHRDHSAGARALQHETGAPLWFAGPHRLSRPARLWELRGSAGAGDWRLQPDRTFFDGERFEIGGLRIAAIATPGHCANHMCYGLDSGTMLSGDHVMGWNSTLVSVPDGSMADYLASLEKVIALPYRTYLPAHGGPIADGPAFSRALLLHRQLRNRQIEAAVTAGAHTVPQLLARIYPNQPLPIRLAAAMTLRAHIEYLESVGRLHVRRGLFGMRVETVA